MNALFGDMTLCDICFILYLFYLLFGNILLLFCLWWFGGLVLIFLESRFQFSWKEKKQNFVWTKFVLFLIPYFVYSRNNKTNKKAKLNMFIFNFWILLRIWSGFLLLLSKSETSNATLKVFDNVTFRHRNLQNLLNIVW